MRRRSLAGALGAVAVFALVAGLSVPATAIHGGDTEVTVGSDDTVFSQNKQNEQRSRSTPRTPPSWLPGRTTISTWRRATPDLPPTVPSRSMSGFGRSLLVRQR